MINLEIPEIQFALQTVRRASLLVRRIQTSLAHQTMMKADRSPVTVADLCSQALVGYLIDRHLPSETLVAEEDSSILQKDENLHLFEQVRYFLTQEIDTVTLPNVCTWLDRGAQAPGRRFWCLDPIDGTKGFLRGDQYAVLHPKDRCLAL